MRWGGPANARANGRLGQVPRLTCRRAGLQPALTVNWALFSAPVLRNCILLPFVARSLRPAVLVWCPSPGAALIWLSLLLGAGFFPLPLTCCGGMELVNKLKQSLLDGWGGQDGPTSHGLCLGLYLLRVREGPKSGLVSLCPRWQVARAVVSIRGRAPMSLVLEEEGRAAAQPWTTWETGLGLWRIVEVGLQPTP